jgi:hypothetical protein
MAVRIHGTFGSWMLPQGGSILGRGTGCDVRIDDPRLSRNHARFLVSGHQVSVAEMGSRNGVLVDGVRIAASTDLHHGQVVVCGPVVLMVSIDQTQPHPRTTQGDQDPTTRRTSNRGDTEAMLAAVSVPPTPGSGGRGIDPAIFAAVSGEIPLEASRQSALQPASMPGSMTSPLEAVRSAPHAPRPASERRSPTPSVSLEAPAFAPSASGALELTTPIRAQASDRLIAGLVDGLGAIGASAGGLLIALFVLAGALASAGATIGGGLPRFGPGVEAGYPAILGALLHPQGLAAGLVAAPLAASTSSSAAVLLVLGAALSAMAVVVGPLLLLVVPTVLHGAPRMHRQRGLVVMCLADSAPLGYGRALLRWLLAALLWPLAIPAALAQRRAPHDVLSGCVVRRVR